MEVKNGWFFWKVVSVLRKLKIGSLTITNKGAGLQQGFTLKGLSKKKLKDIREYYDKE